MPLFLIFAGTIFMVAAVRGNHQDLFGLLKDDFSGAGNYFVWVIAVAVLVALGYVKQLRPVSNAFLVLVLVVIFVANKGLIPSFFEQVKRGTQGN